MLDLPQEGSQQGRGENRQTFPSDDLARHDGEIGLERIEQRLIGLQVLPQHHEQFGVQFPRRDHDRQIAHVVAGAGGDAHGVPNAGFQQGGYPGAVAAHPVPLRVVRGWVVVDDGYQHAFLLQGRDHGFPETAVTA